MPQFPIEKLVSTIPPALDRRPFAGLISPPVGRDFASSVLIRILRTAMQIDRAETLKKSLTDKWVVVDPVIAELRRFAGQTGKVKTVNMNCRALVEFGGTADIGWYDIDPAFLRVVEAPVAKAAPAKAEKPAAAQPAAAAAKPAGKSPLEMARAQGAQKAEGAAVADAPAKKLSPLELARQQGAQKTAGTAAPVADAGKKLSPLELARQQGAQKAAAAPAAAVAPVAAKPAAAEGGKKLSPLEMARQQDAAKKAAVANPVAAPAPVAIPEVAAAPVEVKKPAPAVSADGKKLSPLEMARLQDKKK